MDSIKKPSLFDTLLLLITAVIAVMTIWVGVRYWLVTGLSLNSRALRIVDIGIVLATGLIAIIYLTRSLLPRVASYVGPTPINAVKSVVQLVGLAVTALAVFYLLGVNIVSALVGIGFFGIVVGLAAQQVLGNLLSGIMLLVSRPFRIYDRIALINWQYGKFPPTLNHGWLEPSYTGIVKGISLLYTKILTDYNGLLKVPNGVVAQSLILNLSDTRRTRTGTQFEVPINIDPDDLNNSLSSQLEKMAEFKGEHGTFEVLEISPTSYLVAVTYEVEKAHERDMKAALLRALRKALLSAGKIKDTK
jgi:small-conductance mechanosensitive channel